jgi:hypothetical protein
MSDGFPEDVRRFILEHVNSVEQLEVLLLLRGRPDADWDAAAVSRALSTAPAAAAMRLADLHARGLLVPVKPGEARYRYGPAAPELARLVDGLAEAYRERRVAVVALIYSKPQTQVQAFADAFKLRKEP